MTTTGITQAGLAVRRQPEGGEQKTQPRPEFGDLAPPEIPVGGRLPLMHELSKWGIKIVASCEVHHRDYAATYIPGIGSPREGLVLKSGEIVLEVPQDAGKWGLFKKPPQYQFSASIYTPDDNPKMPQTDFRVYLRSPALNGLQFSASSIHEAVEGAKTALIAHHLVKGRQPFN